MSLVIDMNITRRDGTLQPLQRLVIRRLEPLKGLTESHKYLAEVYNREEGQEVPYHSTELSHEYGEGAWMLTYKAMKELGIVFDA